MSSATYAYTIRESLYLNVTNRCILNCTFCPKNNGTNVVDEYDLTLSRPPEYEDLIKAIDDQGFFDEAQADLCKAQDCFDEAQGYSGEAQGCPDEAQGCKEVVFCGYGEPTLRLKIILRVADYVKARGGRVRLNTDGLANLVHKRNVLPEMKGRIDALSVSMNTDTQTDYETHCQPSLNEAYTAMLEFLKLAPLYIPDVTATAINGLEGVNIDACRRIATSLGVKFRERHLGLVG